MKLPRELPDFERDHIGGGLRNSTDCPVRRVLESYPEYAGRYYAFPVGVGTIGHVLADHFIHRVLTGRETWRQVLMHALAVMTGKEKPILETEYEVEWAHGVTHLDAVVFSGPYKGVWEVKTTSNTKGKVPSANVRQVRRQMFLARAGGYDLPEPWRIVRIQKKWGYIAFDEVEWCDEYAAEFQQELDSTEQVLKFADRKGVGALDDVGVFEAAGLECRCGSCFPKPRVEIEPSLEQELRLLRWVDADLKATDEERRAWSDRKKLLTKQREGLREKLKQAAREGVTVTDGESEIRLAKNGALRIVHSKGADDE